jgi:hypothetical protein
MITCMVPVLTVGTGLTVTVAVIGAPGQPLAVGVIVNVTVIGAFVVLVSVPPILVPLPLAAIPVTVAVLFLVHVNVVPDVALESAIAVIAWPEQLACDAGVATATGVGFTTTVAVIGAPGQPLAVGVIVNVTVTGLAVVLVSEPLMLPVPLAAIPVTVAVLFLVHANVVPPVVLELTIVVIAAPEQIVCDAGVATATGVGLTVIVNVIGVPVHVGMLLNIGVTVIVAVTGALPVFVAVNAPILPVPLAARPIEGLSFVQSKVVVGTDPVNVTAVVDVLLQTV